MQENHRPKDPAVVELGKMMQKAMHLSVNEPGAAITICKDALKKADVICSNVDAPSSCKFVQHLIKLMLAGQYTKLGNHIDAANVFASMDFEQVKAMFAMGHYSSSGTIFDDTLSLAGEAFYKARENAKCIQLLEQIQPNSVRYKEAQIILKQCQFTEARDMPRTQKMFGDFYDPFTQAGNEALKQNDAATAVKRVHFIQTRGQACVFALYSSRTLTISLTFFVSGDRLQSGD